MTEMEIGARYRTRDGRKTGKLMAHNDSMFPFQAKIGKRFYCFQDDGSFIKGQKNALDLIEKLPPKVNKPTPPPSEAETTLERVRGILGKYRGFHTEAPFSPLFIELDVLINKSSTPETPSTPEVDIYGTAPYTEYGVKHVVDEKNQTTTVEMVLPDTHAPAQPELLPCPFDNEYSKGHCLICKAEGPVKDTTEQEAITAWNTRAQPPQTTTLANDREQLIWDIIAAANTANGMGLGLSGQFEAVSKSLPDAQPPRVPDDKLVDGIMAEAKSLFDMWPPTLYGHDIALLANFRAFLQSVLPPDAALGEVVATINDVTYEEIMEMQKRPEEQNQPWNRFNFILENLAEKALFVRKKILPATPTGEPR